MAALDGRVAVITGAGRGIGREHALLFASEGALVVVNDVGSAPDGQPTAERPADEVVSTIRRAGGEAVAHYDDISTMDGARSLLELALDTFGEVHALVNNAGALRDSMLVNMSEDDWDFVVRVNLRGHFCPTRVVAEHWRSQAKAGAAVSAAIVNTTSGSGLLATPGQSNYGAAKAGVAGFTQIVAKELDRYGVRCNAISPAARTRLTEQTPGVSELVKAPEDGSFDEWDPANISPLVAYLASDSCTFTGKVFHVRGARITEFLPWQLGRHIDSAARWTVDGLAAEIGGLLQEEG